MTVAEVNAMLVGTLNGIKVKSLSANDSSFEMIPIGIFNIDDWTDNDDNTLTIKCIDNMSKFEFNYDGSKLEYPTTLLTVLQDICSKAGVELGSTSFLNSNIQVATYDNTVSAREYLSYISECAGGFAFIGRDGKLYIRTIYQDEQEIPLELFGEYKWGDKYKISKVSYENGVESFKFGDDTGNNLWINQENMYIVEENEVKNIYNQLKGLEAYSFEGKVIIDPALDVGDKIIIDGKSVIYQGEADFQTRFILEISSKISIKQKQETTAKTTSQKVLNRRVQSSIDEINGKITQVVQETTANTEKLSKHEQTIDSITDRVTSVETNVETVEDKADKAQTSANNAQSTANTADANAQNAQNTANSINDNLKTNYYTKTETTSQIEQKADEISSTVSKTYSTKTETTNAKNEAINIANNNTNIKLEDYSTTTQMNSVITQKADEINSTVRKKVGKNEIISTINQSAESVKINANKIQLSANDILNLLAGNTINIQSRNIKIASDNFNVDSNGNITANSATLKNVTITDGTIKLKSDDYALGVFRLQGTDKAFEAGASGLAIHSSSGSSNITDEGISYSNYLNGTSTNINSSGIKTHHITINDGGNKNVTIEGNGYLGCDQLYVDATGINCVGNIQAHSHIYCNNGVEPFSLAEKKRDIQKYNNKALEEVLNTDIYYYNYKEDEQDIKKRVGAIIGDKYKCSKEIIGTEGKGIDLYSMISVAYKAIQEQQEIIEKQNKTIEELTARVEKLERQVKNNGSKKDCKFKSTSKSSDKRKPV